MHTRRGAHDEKPRGGAGGQETRRSVRGEVRGKIHETPCFTTSTISSNMMIQPIFMLCCIACKKDVQLIAQHHATTSRACTYGPFWIRHVAKHDAHEHARTFATPSATLSAAP
ncbi:unnamed protein product, partial [Ectocarpus sp. 12 AP-2014]